MRDTSEYIFHLDGENVVRNLLFLLLIFFSVYYREIFVRMLKEYRRNGFLEKPPDLIKLPGMIDSRLIKQLVTNHL
jgi:hypothetical protein